LFEDDIKIHFIQNSKKTLSDIYRFCVELHRYKTYIKRELSGLINVTYGPKNSVLV